MEYDEFGNPDLWGKYTFPTGQRRHRPDVPQPRQVSTSHRPAAITDIRL
jgi:hypothetical protein